MRYLLYAPAVFFFLLPVLKLLPAAAAERRAARKKEEQRRAAEEAKKRAAEAKRAEEAARAAAAAAAAQEKPKRKRGRPRKNPQPAAPQRPQIISNASQPAPPPVQIALVQPVHIFPEDNLEPVCTPEQFAARIGKK